MNNEEKEFLDAIQQANAEDLKRRIVDKVKKIIEQAGLPKDRFKDVSVDISDFLKLKTK